MGYTYPEKAFNWKYLLNLFPMDIIPDLKSRDRQIKPWLSNKKDLEDELLKLGIRLNLIIKCFFDENLSFSKKDLNLGINTDDKPIYLDVINNPVDRVILSFQSNPININYFNQLTAKYMDTGTYLRPHDMLFCIERTKFMEEQIVAWFKRQAHWTLYNCNHVLISF